MKNIDSCVILCGGKSSRLMGVNGEIKALLPFGDKSLVAYNFDKMHLIFKHVFIACKENQKDFIKKSLWKFSKSYKSPQPSKSTSIHPLPPSAIKEKSGVDFYPNSPNDIFIIESNYIFAPIVGIISALTQLQKEKVFFISCDCPFVSYKTIQSLCKPVSNYDIVFAKDSYRSHPLIAVWSAKLLPLLRDLLTQCDYRLQNIIDKSYTNALEFSQSEFFNINTQEDYDIALEMLSQNSSD